MPRLQPGLRVRAPLWMALLTLPGALQACSHPTAPVPPPGGGHSLTYSFDEFSQNVEPVLIRQGCDATGDCHGGGIRGTFELSPPGAKDAQFDFDQAVLQLSAAAPDRSPLVTEPLALTAGGTPHGVKPFATTSDPDYQAILMWAASGVPQ